MAGLRARQSSGPRPRRSATPGRKPSNTTSASSTRRSTRSRPSSDLRSTPMLRRPRAFTTAGGEAGSPPRTEPARSMRMISAPMSASIIPQNGPGPIPANSMTRTPSSAPMTASPPLDRASDQVLVLFSVQSPPSARWQWVAMALISCGQAPGAMSWPQPSTITRSAPGMTAAVRSPPDGVISVSAVPWMTVVGTVIVARSSSRSP